MSRRSASLASGCASSQLRPRSACTMSGNGTVPNSSDMTAVPAAGPASCNSPPTYPVTSADAELPRNGTVRSAPHHCLASATPAASRFPA
ncbi:hypothetical protein G6F50_018445 [Rhizopus delemar]|uniref:Uncharacterized protein n=1 Tax=Rhizopus delemar TaxID=936053 RepID=A0A9P7BYW1_9FUNG|nr:hypothetical protein G6F50_018445 [Rhizopus delemar]